MPSGPPLSCSIIDAISFKNCLLGRQRQRGQPRSRKRIGDFHALAKKLTREYRGRYFYGRWPIATFILSPVFALYRRLDSHGSGLRLRQPVSSTLAQLVDGSEPALATLAEIKLIMGWTAFNAIAPIALAILYTRLAFRAGFRRYWAATSVVQIAMLAGLLGWR